VLGMDDLDMVKGSLLKLQVGAFSSNDYLHGPMFVLEL
jgi:hypothetical protein